MKYSRHLSLLFFIFVTPICFGQSLHRLDTIILTKTYSNIPVITSTENLILSLGISSSMSFNHCISLRVFPRTIADKDTSLCFNNVHYFKKGISYIEKNGKVRLRNIDFKRNKKVFISIDKINLSRKLTLEELMKAYNYIEDDIAGPQLGLMAPYQMRKCRCFYQVNFSTGEHAAVYLELYFDCKKKLRFMSIGAYGC